MVEYAEFTVAFSGLQVHSEAELERIRQHVRAVIGVVADRFNCTFDVDIQSIKGVLVYDNQSPLCLVRQNLNQDCDGQT